MRKIAVAVAAGCFELVAISHSWAQAPAPRWRTITYDPFCFDPPMVYGQCQKDAATGFGRKCRYSVTKCVWTASTKPLVGCNTRTGAGCDVCLDISISEDKTIYSSTKCVTDWAVAAPRE